MAAFVPSPKRQPRIQSPFQKLYASYTESTGTCTVCQQEVPTNKGIATRTDGSGKLYCEEHFCCEACETKIPLGSSFITRHNFPYCKNCIHKKLPQCQLCHLEIRGDSIEALGVSWHLDHFLCHHCHIPLTSAFGQDGFYTHDDYQFCEKDYFEIYAKEAKKPTQTEPIPNLLTVKNKSLAKSPFASPQAKRRVKRKRVSSSVMPTDSATNEPIPRQVSKIRKGVNSLRRKPLRKLLEQEKRGSFLLEKETPSQYVQVRSSLDSFHSNSEVHMSRERRSSQIEDTVTLTPLRDSGNITKEGQEEKVIGKKVIEESILLNNIDSVLKFSDIVGKGGFATVREGILVSNREAVAVKIFNKWELSNEAIIFIKREVGTLSHLKHPNIRQFRNLFEDAHYLYVVMEYIKGESLYDYVERTEKLTEKQARALTRALLQVLEYLHGKGYIHQDIKTENIMLPMPSPTSEIQFEDMKLIDFGFCRELKPGELLREYCGSYHYLAPEMINREPYGFAVDMWSVGVSLYILLSGLRPFFSQEEARQAKIQWFEEDWEEYSPEARKIVEELLTIDPATRLTASQALEHPWFKLD